MLEQVTAVRIDRGMSGGEIWPLLSSHKRSDVKQEDLKSGRPRKQTHIWHRESNQ